MSQNSDSETSARVCGGKPSQLQAPRRLGHPTPRHYFSGPLSGRCPLPWLFCLLAVKSCDSPSKLRPSPVLSLAGRVSPRSAGCELHLSPVQGQDHVQLRGLFRVTCQVSLLLVRPKLRSPEKGVGTPHFQDLTGTSSPLMLTPTRAGPLLYQQVTECGLEPIDTISHDKKSGGR